MKRTQTYRLSQFLHRADCVVEATPISPEPVENSDIDISTFEITTDNRVNFSIAWLNPNATYGEATGYEVVVTKYPLMGLDSIESSGAVIFRNSGTFMSGVSNPILAACHLVQATCVSPFVARRRTIKSTMM